MFQGKKEKLKLHGAFYCANFGCILNEGQSLEFNLQITCLAFKKSAIMVLLVKLLWRDINYRNSKDCMRMAVNLKELMFRTL